MYLLLRLLSVRGTQALGERGATYTGTSSSESLELMDRMRPDMAFERLSTLEILALEQADDILANGAFKIWQRIYRNAEW